MTLGVLALAWLLGIAAAAFSGSDPWAAVAAASALAAITFAFRPRASTLALVALGAVLVLAAAWRYDSTRPPDAPTGIARLNDDADVRFRALIDAEPDDRGSYVLYRLAVRERLTDRRWRPESGRVLMRAAPFPQYEYGDLLEVEGALETPPTFAGFDYREHLLRRGIASLIAYPDTTVLATGRGDPFRASLIELRHRLSDALSDALPEPEASLAGGVLLGTRSALPPDLRDDMNATGTSHLVAVSGQNVALLAGLLMAVLAGVFGRRPAAWLALAGIVGYALLVGGQPSVQRAAVMGGLYVVATALGRQNSGATGLALAGAAMTGFDPQLAHDASFQLSFAATLGLLILTPLLRARAEAAAGRWPSLADFPLTRPTIEMAAVTLAAIAFTLPITAVNFQRVSLVAPIANLLAVPAFIAVAVTAAVTALAGATIPAASDYLGWLAWPPAAYMAGVIRLAAGVPLASLELRGVGVGHAIAGYALLVAGVWLLTRAPAPAAPPRPRPLPAEGPRPLFPAAALALIFALSSLLFWLAISAPAGGRLTVTFLDVGQGDAILIEGPAGHRLLVDGGPSEDAISAALGRHLPFYDRRIDLVVSTHPQADHIGGLPAVLERYDVGGVLTSPLSGDSAAYRAWREALGPAHLPSTAADAGRWIDLGAGARLLVLHPASVPLLVDDDELNSYSTVIKLTMGRVSILLTADADEQAERTLLRNGADLRAAVLKVGHHGSATSTSPPFLARVRPLVDVISVGARNPFDHPAPALVDRLSGDLILRTDRHGDVTVETDGDRLWVRTQRRGE